MTTITETEVVQACQTLFGADINISTGFLHYMQPSGVKSAYRKKAKENHPDLFAADPLHVQQKQTALFRDILQAYDVLNLFFKQREDGAWTSSPKSAQPRKPAREEKQPASSAPRNGDETFFYGIVPFRILQIGQYLYYRGKISFGSLINALVWQRKQRPSFGEIALRWGWLNAEGHDKVMKSCDRPRRFGEKAVELGLLSVFQVNAILLYQRSQQGQLGSYFILNKMLSHEDLEQLVQELKQHNAGVLANSQPKSRKQGMHA
jgi:hypothetical protein